MTYEQPSRGNWMQTFTGRAFYPLDPRPEDIDLRDIAHALSLTCRYGGHVRVHYSVAEHCVLMSYAVPPQDALAALLHDGAEAYVGDMPRPLKRMLPEYSAIEDRILDVICRRFGISTQIPAAVKTADNRILLDERAALLGPTPMPWSDYMESLDPLGVLIEGWAPADAEAEYYARFNQLAEEGFR